MSHWNTFFVSDCGTDGLIRLLSLITLDSDVFKFSMKWNGLICRSLLWVARWGHSLQTGSEEHHRSLQLLPLPSGIWIPVGWKSSSDARGAADRPIRGGAAGLWDTTERFQSCAAIGCFLQWVTAVGWIWILDRILIKIRKQIAAVHLSLVYQVS